MQSDAGFFGSRGNAAGGGHKPAESANIFLEVTIMCTKYDYLEAMTADVLDYIEENIDLTEYADAEELESFLNDELWTEDSVTGNASGSYYCNTYKAEEAIAHNTDLLIEAIEEFGGDAETYKKALQSPEYADITIRCYLLGQAITEAIERLDYDFSENENE